jgi:hypothetical protein
MKEINYVEYQHSYAHALAGTTEAGKPVMNAIRFAACQKRDASFTFNLIKKYVFQNPNVIYTDKETEFHSDIKQICIYENNPVGAYYRCKNALKAAEEIVVKIDDNGNLIER